MGKSLVVSFLILCMPFGLSLASDSRLSLGDYRTANKLFASGQHRDALSLYQRLLVAPPEGVPVSELQTRIGDSWFSLGNFKNALEAYRKALSEQSETDQPATQYWIGFCCFLLGRDGEARAEFLKIPEQFPWSGRWVSTAYYWAGRVSERMGKPDEAAAYYRKAGGNGKTTQGKFALKKAEAARKP